jgi:hypothetical protein
LFLFMKDTNLANLVAMAESSFWHDLRNQPLYGTQYVGHGHGISLPYRSIQMDVDRWHPSLLYRYEHNMDKRDTWAA